MNEKPNYYAIIPANVRYDNELKDKAKLLYGEITSLSTKDGYCYASNKYFANLYNVSITTISLLIKNLVDKGYIESEIVYKEGTKEILNRYLKIIKDPYLKNLKYPIKENLKDNNININNTRYNNININNKEIYKESKKKFGEYKRVLLTEEEYNKLIKEYGKEFIDYQIMRLDEYVESNNNKNKYKNFNLVLRKAIREKWFKEKEKKLENNYANKNYFKELLEEYENDEKRNTYDAEFTESSIS